MTTSAVSLEPSRRPLQLGDALRDALASVRDPAAVAVVSVPAPLAPLEALLAAAPAEDALLFEPIEGTAFSAVGAVANLRGHGSARVAQIRADADAVFRSLQTVDLGDTPAPSVRFLGGFSFQPGASSSEPWTDFGDARFVLPRFRYARQGDHAWLSVAARREDVVTDSAVRELVAATERTFATLRAASHDGPVVRRRPAPWTVASRVEVTLPEWTNLVEKIVTRISRREFEKVVIARRTTLSFDGPIDLLDVVTELGRSATHCTRFAFRFGRSTFLGATPERLIRRKGPELATEALAGTSRVGDASSAAEMMNSPKEREEHELVVRQIVETLSPVCESLEHPRSPEVRVLPHLVHLTTPIRGRLHRPVHVLELVERLHPTPAVGGVPTSGAVQFIRAEEPAERGWYASPIGWFDAKGDGEFAVGLRSGAIVDNRAYLYAGSGIVRDSDPASEYAETRLKLETLCAALHVVQ